MCGSLSWARITRRRPPTRRPPPAGPAGRRRRPRRRRARGSRWRRWPGSRRRATTSSSSSRTSGSSCSVASSARRSRTVARPSTSFIRLRRRRSDSVPSASTCARCSASLASSSSIPSPRCASVLMIGTGQLPCGASVSTPRISRTIVSVSGWSALLTTITSGISITPALSAWIESPEPGISTSTTRVRVVDHVDLRLADADRLQEHVVAARGVHQQRGLQRRLGEPAERAARRHRADEHAGVQEVLGEPDPVAQQRAAAERRARVDREHRDLAVGLAPVRDERADQRRLAGAGRAGEPDHLRVAGVRIDLAHERPALAGRRPRRARCRAPARACRPRAGAPRGLRSCRP